MADLSESIKQNAAGPAKAAGDRGSMEQHPISQQIAADRYTRANSAASASPLAGIRRFKIRRGGAVNLRRELDNG